jgi:hypothetical protein
MDIIGFTGTQRGMTRIQKSVLRGILQNDSGEFHHGDCIGADEEAHDIASELGYDIWVHPPKDPSKRAFCKAPNNRMMFAKPYLVRNHDIVDVCTKLIATPGEAVEQLRSGTWATIRYARKVGKEVTIIFPNGDISDAKNR